MDQERISIVMRPDWFGDAQDARPGWSGSDSTGKHILVVFRLPEYYNDNKQILWTYADASGEGNPTVKRGWWYSTATAGDDLYLSISIHLKNRINADIYFEEE